MKLSTDLVDLLFVDALLFLYDFPIAFSLEIALSHPGLDVAHHLADLFLARIDLALDLGHELLPLAGLASEHLHVLELAISYYPEIG